jgi:hypothetical protein
MRTTILISAFILLLAGIAYTQSKSEAYKFAEFGPMSQTGVKAKMDGFLMEMSKDRSRQGYIFIYGTAKAIAARRKQITNTMPSHTPDPSRITFVDMSAEKKVRTVMWIVPPGAAPPTP